MTPSPDAASQFLIWFLVVPAVLVWAQVVVDIVTRPGLSAAWRLVWVVVVTVFLPAALAWLLLRPAGDPLRKALVTPDADDPAAQLVQLVVDHDAGRIDDVAFGRRRDEIFGSAGG
jgi:hypothetical protein